VETGLLAGMRQETKRNIIISKTRLTLLVECNNCLGDSLADSKHLGSVSTTLHADADVNVGESASTEQKDRLVGLHAEHFRLEELDGASVDLDESLSALAQGHSNCGFLQITRKKRHDYQQST
jgi:hypothetical protein